jgi:hypothetical protein
LCVPPLGLVVPLPALAEGILQRITPAGVPAAWRWRAVVARRWHSETAVVLRRTGWLGRCAVPGTRGRRRAVPGRWTGRGRGAVAWLLAIGATGGLSGRRAVPRCISVDRRATGRAVGLRRGPRRTRAVPGRGQRSGTVPGDVAVGGAMTWCPIGRAPELRRVRVLGEVSTTRGPAADRRPALVVRPVPGHQLAAVGHTSLIVVSPAPIVIQPNWHSRSAPPPMRSVRDPRHPEASGTTTNARLRHRRRARERQEADGVSRFSLILAALPRSSRR